MNRRETLEQILKFTCDYYGIDVETVKSRNRKQELVQARHIFVHIAKMHKLGFLLMEICEVLNLHHASIIHALKVVSNRCNVEPKFKQLVEEIEQAYIKKYENHLFESVVNTYKNREAERLEVILDNKQKLILQQMQELEANRKELDVLRDYYNKTHKLPEVLKLLNA